MSKKSESLDPKLEAAMANAVETNDVAAVKRLLADGFPIEAKLKSQKNLTALGLANARGVRAYDAAIALLDAGANWRKAGINLLWAIYFKNEAVAQRLIAEGADVNQRSHYGDAPLAMVAGDPAMLNIAKMLIDAGADVNDGALKPAVGANNIELVELLLERGAELPEGEALLSMAVFYRRPQIAKALIAAGADVNERESFFQRQRKSDGTPIPPNATFDEMRGTENVKVFAHATPLMVAAATGQEDMLQMLLEAGADPRQLDANGNDALALAKQKNQTSACQMLEKALAAKPAKANPNFDLLLAAEKGDLDGVKQSLEAGADVNARDTRPLLGGLTPLMLAARNGHADVVAALLEAGADISLIDNLESEPQAGFSFILNEAGIDQVLEAGYQLHRSALHWAAAGGHAAAAKVLIEHGADVKALDRAKMSPLMHAAESGAVDLVAELLARGVDPNERGRKKRTALMIAAQAGHADVVNALIAAGAKVDLKDSDSRTALLEAASRANCEAVGALLAAGADVNLACDSPANAIAAAIGPSLYENRLGKNGPWLEFKQPKERILKTIKHLIDAGADPNLKNDTRGFTAMQWAERGLRNDPFFQQVIDLLKTANPRQAIKPVPSAKAAKSEAVKRPSEKPTKKPAKHKPSEESIAPPDFSDAAESREFEAALSELENETGTKRQPLPNVSGGFVFHVHSSKRKNFSLEKLQAGLLARGCLIFNTVADPNTSIAALPTRDRYDALRAMLTNGANEGHMPEDIIAWLEELEKDQPFILTTAGFDFVGGKFTSKLAKPTELAERMIEFCTDLMDSGDAEEIGEELARSQSFFFWWD